MYILDCFEAQHFSSRSHGKTFGQPPLEMIIWAELSMLGIYFFIIQMKT